MNADLIKEKIREERKILDEENLDDFEEKVIELEEKIRKFIEDNS